MLLSVFIVLLGLAGFLLWVGYAYGAQVFQLVSFFFLFILGLQLMGGAVMVSSGVNETVCGAYTTYEYDANGTVLSTNSSYEGCVALTQTLYDAIDDEWSVWMGRFLSIASALAIIYFFFTIRSRRWSP